MGASRLKTEAKSGEINSLASALSCPEAHGCHYCYIILATTLIMNTASMVATLITVIIVVCFC